MSKVISETTGPIYNFFKLVDLWQILHSFCDRSRDVAIATNFRGKIGVLAYQPSFVAQPIQNGLEYRNANGHFRSTFV